MRKLALFVFAVAIPFAASAAVDCETRPDHPKCKDGGGGPKFRTVPVTATGQLTCSDADGYDISCDGTGQDGETQAGVQPPDPRFQDNGDGTITDLLTGLIWLKNASCLVSNYPELAINGVTWQLALDFVAGINTGTYSCGTSHTGWRLPNPKELISLGDYERGWNGPGLPAGHPFVNAAGSYWTSTSLNRPGSLNNQAYDVRSLTHIGITLKTDPSHAVWAVKGP